MDLVVSKIEGKPITRFPVYLEKKGEPRNIQVATNFNDVTRLMKDGATWINRGAAPYEQNRAVMGSKPSSSIKVTKSFEVFRVTEIISNGSFTDRDFYKRIISVRLFPKAKFAPSSTWLMANRPRVGGYILRHEDDYYTFISDKQFDRQYAGSLDAATLAKFNNCVNPPKPKHEKSVPVAKVEEVVDVVEDVLVETTEGEDVAAANEFLNSHMEEVEDQSQQV